MMRAFVFLALLCMAACSSNKKENVSTVEEAPERNELPPLQVTLVTGERVMVNSLPGNTILIFYNPDCDHCQREAKAISGQLEAFKNYSLYFIAPGAMEEMNRFASAYGLSGFSNVRFAQTEVADVIRLMGPFPTPSLYIYSSGKRLVKKFSGETDVDEIVKFL